MFICTGNMLNLTNAIVEEELPDAFAINYLQGKTDAQLPASRLIYNRLILVEDGEGELQIDEMTYPVLGNELFLLSKGQIIYFKPDCKIMGYEICFGDYFWEKSPASASNCKSVLFNNTAINQVLPLNRSDKKEICALFKTLHHEYLKSNYINKTDALAAYLKIIMIKVANINASLIKGYDNQEKMLYRKFIELISTQYQKTHEVSEYANQLGIPARKLSELSRRCSGSGAKDLINGQILAEAKRSLQFSSSPIKEIAFQLNFSTPEQFSHFFKKYVSASPADYRKRHINIGM
jgi:AraC family transcriptional activator of pobA